MKMLVTIDENKCLNVEFIDQGKQRFGLWFGNLEAGWFFVNKSGDDSAGYVNTGTLNLIYDKIGKILGK